MPIVDSMKGKLRKELRAKRRSLSAAEHALRSNLAASSITRLAAFKAGAPRRHLSAVRSRGEHRRAAGRGTAPAGSHFRSGGQRPAAPPPALLPIDGKDAARGVRHFGTSPQRPSDRAALVRSDRRTPGRRRCRGSPLGNGRRILRSRPRLQAAPAALDAARAWSASPSSASGRTRCAADPWDVRLDSLATESGLRFFSRGTIQ